MRHRHGVLVFDTGVGRGNAFIDEQYAVVHHGVESALAAHGHSLADVTDVVCSHLHFDHCGGNRLFPGVPIHVQAAELALVDEPHFTIPEWVHFDGSTYVPHDGDAPVRGGMRLLATPGHTAGHQALVLDGPSGPVVLGGQAVYSAGELAHVVSTGRPLLDEPPDLDAYLASVDRIVALAPVQVHLAHDTEVFSAG